MVSRTGKVVIIVHTFHTLFPPHVAHFLGVLSPKYVFWKNCKGDGQIAHSFFRVKNTVIQIIQCV